MNEDEYIIMYEAEETHWWYVSLHDLILRSVPRNLPSLTIFDAGCGTGRLLQLLSPYGSVQGCDASETALHCCRKRGLTTVAQADLNTMTLAQESYDVITLIDVLYHAGIRDEHAVLKKLHAALKPGGVLLVQVPAYEWLRSDHDRAVHTRRRYSRPEIVAMLRDCGFLVEKATYRVGLLLLPIAMVRLARNLVRLHTTGAEAASDVKKHFTLVNALLSAIMVAENRLLKYVSLPFGASVFAVARKQEVPGKDLLKESR